MFKCISDNYQWVFSGIGVSLITVIVISISNQIKKVKAKTINIEIPKTIPTNVANVEEKPILKEVVMIQKSDDIFYKEVPSGSEINKDIYSQPILMQEQYAASFINHRFSWKVKLYHAYLRKDKMIRLMFKDNGYSNIKGNIDPEKYPEIMRKKSDEIAIIKGKILKIDSGDIEVEIDDMVFIDKDLED
jgi:hypothetical protein